MQHVTRPHSTWIRSWLSRSIVRPIMIYCVTWHPRNWASVVLLLTISQPTAAKHSLISSTSVKIADGVFCLPNPPSDRVCRATPAISEYLYVKALDKLHLDRLPAGRRKKLRRRLRESSCIGDGGDFPALKREYGYEYFVCTFHFQVYEDAEPFGVFLPSDDQDKIGDCDILPWLIRLSTTGTGMVLTSGILGLSHPGGRQVSEAVFVRLCNARERTCNRSGLERVLLFDDVLPTLNIGFCGFCMC